MRKHPSREPIARTNSRPAVITMVPTFGRRMCLASMNRTIGLVAAVPRVQRYVVFGEPTLADTILDRIIHNAHPTATHW